MCRGRRGLSGGVGTVGAEDVFGFAVGGVAEREQGAVVPRVDRGLFVLDVLEIHLGH